MTTNMTYYEALRPVLGKPTAHGADALVQCGWCGSDCNQLMAPVVHFAGDDHGPLGLQGSWVEMPVECEECGHVTVLVFGFHKGQVHMAARVRGSDRDIISQASR